ncbi:DNA-binding protein WhiA [Selenomonas sp. TAMA-11512]|uniref:DNA-binding protein WhiA n=1 Tax=Selenomonas sp. TAMA-11512 TaxID=3095337 RepID=UPI003086569F|nr:DNA-binding protein WhiA [Selenomonas sp. TAMA-11512]
MRQSFATEVKNNLSRELYPKACCRTAELSALLRMGATLTLSTGRAMGLSFVTENAAIARKAIMLLKGLGGVYTEVSMIRARRLLKNNTYNVRVMPAPEVSELLDRLGLMRGMGRLREPEEDMELLEKDCCKYAYLRGAFLGGGSVNRPEASYHLELVTENQAMASFLLRILQALDYPARMTDRKDRYIVYIKDSESIIDFLAALGAEKAADDVEAARNLKEVRNQVNRIVNCETANVSKAVEAAGREIAAIHTLEAAGMLDELDELLRETVEARLAHPEATRAELGRILSISKSGLSHRLRRLQALAQTYREY